MWYAERHETTYLRANADRRRAASAGAEPALAGCLHLAPLPDAVGQFPRRTGTPHRRAVGLRRPNRTRCPACLQRSRAGVLAEEILAGPPHPPGLRLRT